MPDTWDAFRYIGYLGKRWRFVASATLLATLGAWGVSLLLPVRYPATARIVIEPPAGTDLRSAMAVSPIYLESLRTYEHFASGETLFQRALDRFHLRGRLGPRPIESIKKQVLRTEVVRSTKILAITATLADPRDAQALAQYLAQETVTMSRSVVQEGDRDLLAGIERERDQAKARLQQIEETWQRTAVNEPVEALQTNIRNAGTQLSRVAEFEMAADLEIAEARGASEREEAKARLSALRRQQSVLDRELAVNEALLGQRQAHREALLAERKAIEADWVASEARLRDARNESGYRGERLKVIDPGIVPERPSWPNVPLNVTLAFLLSLFGSAVYLAIGLNYRELRHAALSEMPRLAMRTGDD